MHKYAIYGAFIVLVALLSTLLFVLVDIDRNGITLNISGRVDLTDSATGTLGKVNLVMDKPVSLIATGPGSAAIPASLTVATCPKCGGSMVPVRWNPLTGEIVWQCLECGYTTKDLPDSSANPAGR